MGGGVEMQDAPSVVSQNQEHVQDLKPDRRHGKEVDRHHGFDVILQERPPVLRWRIPRVYDVFADARLADINAEFEELAALNEQHLRRLIRDYVKYHHEDRTHDSLQKDTPNKRPVVQRPSASATVISMPRLGGLHHRYGWSEAA